MRESRTKPRTDQASAPPVILQMALPVVEMFGAIEEHFIELCVHAGQQVLHAMMEADRTRQCGPKWIADASRKAQRAGSTASAVALGGRRIAMKRMRARSRAGAELAVASFAWAAARHPLDPHPGGDGVADRAM